MNKLMGSMTADPDGTCKVEDIQEKWAHEFSQLIPLTYFLDCIHMLSPENEGRVRISDWFDCQRSIANALNIVLICQVRCAGHPLAEEAAAEVLRFPTSVKLLHTRVICIYNV